MIRHKLVDVKMKLDAIKAQLDLLCWQIRQGHMPVSEICRLNSLSTGTLEWIAGEAVEIFGGAGYLRGAKVERSFRETKVLSICGVATEIMKDIASR